MDADINIFVFSHSNFSFYISKEISNISYINFNGCTENIEHMKEHFMKNKKDVLLVKYGDLRADQVEGIYAYLKGSAIKNIAVCENIKDGFSLLNIGASDIFILPNGEEDKYDKKTVNGLISKVKNVYNTDYGKENREYKMKVESSYKKVVCIGASTGGTEAVEKILKKMPKNSPPILIVQHMPPIFTKIYAERLNSICEISVWEAKDGDKVMAGLALIAPGDQHMQVIDKNGEYYVRCKAGDKVDGHCPSVSLLFESASKIIKDKAVGVILTGMGADGATGLLKMKNAGAFTIGQDKSSSIVYGMPKAAYELGAVLQEESIDKIAELILKKAY